MTFELQENEKFACIALHNVSRDKSFDELDLGDGLWVTSKIPFDLDDTWRKWMGSLKSEAFAKSDFVIIAKKQSSKPEILDEEHQELGRRVYGLFLMLLMHGVPNYDEALDAKGSMIKGETNTREFGPVDVHYIPADVMPKRINRESIDSAANLEAKLRAIYAAKSKHMRFKRGFHAWRRGIMESHGDNMLHQCVRAVEALLHPSAGKTTDQFAHRCQTFTTRSKDTTNLLRELYELRSCTEHMNDWDKVLAKYDSTKREHMANFRSYQAFLLASYVYRRVIGDNSIFHHFSSDNLMDTFWDMLDDEKDRIWGTKIDLELEAKLNFRPD